MKAVITIRLDKELQVMLNKAAKRSRRSRSELVRQALKRQLSILEFEHLRRKVMPFAEARGYLTDEDIFQEVS